MKGLQKENLSGYRVDYGAGLVEEGSDARTAMIREVLNRAAAGEDITVAFLGGSITQGAAATDDKRCYAYRVFDSLAKTYPKSRMTYVNAGIGATDSEFAAARLSEDILSADPDLVLMEFAVNDGDHNKESYEGCVRQILASKPGIALILMCNVFYDSGSSTERIHREVARHYGIPVLSMRTTIYDAILKGYFPAEKITADYLHPNDDGHALVAEVICTYLDSVMSGGAAAPDVYEASGNTDIPDLPESLTLNRYEYSIRYDNRNSASVLKAMSGFTSDERPCEAPRDCFKRGYSATDKGSFAQYEVEGSCIAVIFKRTIDLPAPVARAVVDGDEESAVILDANFDQTWGDMLVITDIYKSEKSSHHTVRLEITEAHPDDKGDFYLGGIIVSG